jgi:hypothetical protein
VPFDERRAILRGPDQFQRFDVPGGGEPLADAGLDPDSALLVPERGGESRALIVKQMAYHHLAQGTLAGEPYLVSF